MSPSRRKRPDPPKPALPPADPGLLDIDMVALVGKAIAQAGRKYALLGKVEALTLSESGKSVEAKVRGDRSAPYQVEVQLRHHGIVGTCECDSDEPLCVHSVATLEMLKFPLPSVDESIASAKRRRSAGRAGYGRGKIIQTSQSEGAFRVFGGADRTMTREERVAMAHEEELQARLQRSRREKAAVQMLPADGGPPKFEVAGSSEAEPYLVTLRGAKADLPSCTCPDYMKSELGRCKHSERARAWYVRKKKNIPQDVISVWWSPRVWIEEVPKPLLEIRVDSPSGELPDELKPFIQKDGYLKAEESLAAQDKQARSLVDAAKAWCAKEQWHFDLDAMVTRELTLSEHALNLQKRLGGIDESHPIWKETIQDLGFNLHEYQVEGALFLGRLGRAFLADDMGLGKTIQAIVGALLLRKTADIKRAMVVCPASLKHQWRREIEKACGEKAVVIEGRRSLRLEQYNNWKNGFLIINYELVLRDLEEIRSSNPSLVVLDEAQRIKNWDTKTAKAVKELKTPYAFVLTGTPLENRLGELHSLVEFLYPRALGPRWRLRPFHSITDAQGRDIAYEGLDILRKRLKDFFLRRERHQVLDQLPERTDNTFWMEMTGAQRRPYRRYAARVASILSGNNALAAGEVRALLQSLTRMRILCNALAQHDWDRFESLVLSGKPAKRIEIKQVCSPKLEEFENVLEDLLEEGESKVVVFSQWERMLRLAHFVVRGLLEARGESAEVFHGGLHSKKRDEILTRFQNDDDLKVLFSTDAGGQGLNLQEAASIVVNLEVPWNPAVLEQRIGRVHRIGQRRGVRVINFVTQDAIEERVQQVVDGKRALFEGLLVDEVDQVQLATQDRSSLVEQVRELVEVEARKEQEDIGSIRPANK